MCCCDCLPPGFRARSWNRNLEPGEPPQNLDVEPEPAVTTGNLGPTVRNRNLEPIHGTCSVFLSCSLGADPCELFVWEKLLYAHLIADWPRHNFHEKSKKSAGFFRFFLRILAFFTFAGTWNLQRPLEPEPGTWPLHRLGATVAEPEPGTSGTCWAGHRGTGTSEPRRDPNNQSL